MSFTGNAGIGAELSRQAVPLQEAAAASERLSDHQFLLLVVGEGFHGERVVRQCIKEDKICGEDEACQMKTKRGDPPSPLRASVAQSGAASTPFRLSFSNPGRRGSRGEWEDKRWAPPP